MSQKWVPRKPNFGPPPAGYVAGLGRGATGFVTRSDLGPAARATNIVQMKASQNDEAAYADNKFDSWEGYKGALFTKEQVDDEDKQADDAFDFCQKRMDERRLKEKERKMKQQQQKLKNSKKNINNMPISEHFTDLKRELAKVTHQQWLNLPESTDSSIAKRKRERYTPVPDSMLVNYLSSNTNRTQVDPVSQSNKDYREAKDILLRSNLEKAENQTGSKAAGVDRIGYLTHLDVSKVNEEMLGDIKRARMLHKAALASNQKNADIWLSAARIEEFDGKMQECRNILYKALQNCPTNEDIWIELSRVERAEQSKNVLFEALKNLPKSQKLWLTVARKQDSNKETKSKVLRRALENLPQSPRLWKELIELEDVSEAKNLLYKAVECLPKEVDLWIGLAKLETYENAKQILNKARKANPLNLSIWISAAKLEQTQSHSHQKAVNKIEQIITKGREILKKNGNSLSREQLIQQALICQKSGNIITCESIIKSVISLGLTEEQINHSIFKDVDLYEKQYESVETVRFLYRYGIMITKNPRIFQKMLEFQERLAIADLRDHKNKKSQVLESLQFGLKVFPSNLEFWLAMIDKLIFHRNYDQAEKVISTASQNFHGDDKEKILIKKVQIFKQLKQIDAARKMLRQLRQSNPQSTNLAMEAAWFEFHLQNNEEAWKVCSQVFKKQVKSQNVWQLALEIKIKIGAYEQCKNIAQKAVNQCPKSIKLWQLYVQIELKYKFEGKARTILDRALMKNPKNEQIYLTLIGLQLSSRNKKQISSTLSKALKECPKCGQIWAIAILQQPHNGRKNKANVAIQQCGDSNSALNCAIAKLFWKENKIDKARKWLQQIVFLDRENGDNWAYYMKLMSEHFPAQKDRVLEEFRQVGHIVSGRKWMRLKQKHPSGWCLSQEQLLFKLIDQIGDEIHEIE